MIIIVRSFQNKVSHSDLKLLFVIWLLLGAIGGVATGWTNQVGRCLWRAFVPVRDNQSQSGYHKRQVPGVEGKVVGGKRRDPRDKWDAGGHQKGPLLRW